MPKLLNTYLSRRNTALGFFLVTLIALIYHTLIITGVIPPQYVWGGQFNDFSELIKMEIVSILVQLVMVSIVLVSIRVKPSNRFRIACVVCLNIIGVLMLLNTIGNLLAAQLIETIIFTPLTLLSAIFAFRLAYIIKNNSSLTPEPSS